MGDSSSQVLLQARLRVISDCSMYFAYEPQYQICTAPNGPAEMDHGFVFIDIFFIILFDYLDLVKVIVVVVCSISKMVVGMLPV